MIKLFNFSENLKAATEISCPAKICEESDLTTLINICEIRAKFRQLLAEFDKFAKFHNVSRKVSDVFRQFRFPAEFRKN